MDVADAALRQAFVVIGKKHIRCKCARIAWFPVEHQAGFGTPFNVAKASAPLLVLQAISFSSTKPFLLHLEAESDQCLACCRRIIAYWWHNAGSTILMPTIVSRLLHIEQHLALLTFSVEVRLWRS
jgi:hypothetical protein